MAGARRVGAPTLEWVMANSLTVESGCVEWQRHVTTFGHGQIRVDGRGKLIHRLVYELMHGEIAEGVIIRHRCDNPKCVNPEHLVPGTRADNSADMVERGRSCAGSKHWRAAFTEAQVLEIRESRVPSKILAPLYGVGSRCIRRIRQGVAWKHSQKAGA